MNEQLSHNLGVGTNLDARHAGHHVREKDEQGYGCGASIFNDSPDGPRHRARPGNTRFLAAGSRPAAGEISSLLEWNRPIGSPQAPAWGRVVVVAMTFILCGPFPELLRVVARFRLFGHTMRP